MTDMHPPAEEIQDLLDGRLEAERRTGVEAHVARCAVCRGELEALRRARDAAAWLPALEQGSAWASRLGGMLDLEDRRATRVRRVRRFVLPAAAVLVAVAGTVLILESRAPVDLPGAALRSFLDYRRTAFVLDTASADAPALEGYFGRHGIAFPTRVFDLGMMGYGLVGARVHTIGRRPSALFVYRRSDGQPLVCQMYEGTLSELPSGGELREHDGITFRVFQRNGATLVFWEEGAVVCVLVSAAPPEEVVQLAYAKARKA